MKKDKNAHTANVHTADTLCTGSILNVILQMLLFQVTKNAYTTNVFPAQNSEGQNYPEMGHFRELDHGVYTVKV